MSAGLIWRLRDGGNVLPVQAEPGREVIDALARIAMQSADAAVARWRGGEAHLRVERHVREAIVRRPDAVWVVDLDAEGHGTMSPFAPPRVVDLDAAVAIRVDPSVEAKLPDIRLKLGADLCRIGVLPLAEGAIALVGQRSIAAMSEADARGVTWWLPDGDAVELRLEEEGGRAWFVLCDVVQARDARTASCGPNTIVRLGRGASATLATEAHGSCSSADVACFRPARAPTFDAWARYSAIARTERVERETARMAAPLAFENARARGRSWLADARIDAATLTAWLGDDLREGRSVEVGQTAALEGDDEGQFVVQRIKVTSRATAELQIETRGSTRRLPASGKLHARENRGDKVRERREREALEVLSRGGAACDRLVDRLAGPSRTTPPTLKPLPQPTRTLLDEHQRTAVALIVGCEEFVAIQGPPGTGKSEVIAEALRQIAALPRPEGKAPRVLVSSVQNEAVSNVVDRIGGDADGLLIRIVQRSAQDEEETIAFAKRIHAGRDGVVVPLRARLAGNDVTERMERVRNVEATVGHLRALLAAGEPTDRLAAELDAIDGGEVLPSLLVDEARRLAETLRLAAPPVRDASAATRPRRPEDVPAWWGASAEAWPAERRAEMSLAVAALAEATSDSNEARRRLYVARRWADLSRLVDAQPEEGPESGPTASPPGPLVDAWVASALASLREARALVEGSPEAIAVRFLQALEEDTQAWRSIVDRHADAVAATCSMSARAAREPGETFDWVIIDEAGRASPFELLIPMVQGRRVVLIGDHRQLPPMVDDALVRRVEAQESLTVDLRYTSLFEEILNRLPSACRTRLAVQYRMHGDIGATVDRLFYRPKGEGVASFYEGVRAAQRLSAYDVFARAPVGWLDVPTRDGCSEDNPREATAVVEVLRRYAAAGCPDAYVAVICPYRIQRTRIEALIKKEPELQRVAQVRTIDQVQGRDYEVVLLCTTRTDGKPGFLASPNRVNVAISRARRQLVVLGHKAKILGSNAVRRNAPHLHELARTLPELSP
jgi:hypothetical protein